MYWFLYDSDGEINEAQQIDVTKWTNLNGYAGALGLEESDTGAQDAFLHKSHYAVQNGTLVKTVTDAQLLSEAVSAQISSLSSSMNATLAGGFTAKSTGHTYPSNMDSQNNMQAALLQFSLDSTKTAEMYMTIDEGMVSHTQQDLKNVFIEGGRWKNAQYAQFATLKAQVKQLATQAGTTVAQVQAVTWTAADYQGVAQAPA